MKAGKKISTSEVKRKLIADADNPGAWDEPIKVPPSRAARPEWYRQTNHLELAARFYVLSLLHRLGAEANLTYEQPHNIDITAVKQSGEALSIEVKTLAGTSQWDVEKFSARKHHFLVFVCFEYEWRDPQIVPDVYIWPSERLKAFINRKKATTISVPAVASQLDPTSAWEEFVSQRAA